ncbi:MAG: hypothetical protein LUC95_08820 [Lachnospiraceae bacterium]|nr:hypothetical protein [Lachnospiraceae bacterium]
MELTENLLSRTWNALGGVETNVYQYLTRTLDGALYLELLKSAEEIDDTDGIQYNCELWDFIYDTDGNNMTSFDIRFCFDEYMPPIMFPLP